MLNQQLSTKHIPGGTFGLERETLRVTAEGYLSHTLHPFPDDEHIVKDFCENQAEINTGVYNTAQGVLKELQEQSDRLNNELKKNREIIWLYSNPPYILSEDDIPVALYEGDQQGKHSYRLYLAEKYGKYKMTLSGIHVNYSLSEQLLITAFSQSELSDYTEYKNAAYLRLAEGMTEYGWILNLLLSASPICDGSFFNPRRTGETVITDYASLRCGMNGYWNDFTPILQYDSILAYAESIQKYLDSGALAGVGELYYPIRLKPKGANRLNNLVQNGVNHIELRNIDINPFSETGMDVRDLEFIELMCIWIFAVYRDQLTEADQIRAVENFKTAALFDIDSAPLLTRNEQKVSVREAGLRVLSRMTDYYKGNEKALDLLNYQQKKLQTPGARYAEQVIDAFGDKYVRSGLTLFR